MKFFFEGWWHPKNKHGLNLMIQEGMDVDFSFNPNTEYDWIVNLSEFKIYEDHKGGVIYGPHIMFPDVNKNQIPNVEGRTYCNLLSNWNKELCEDINPGIKCLSLPFAVDINDFIPKEKNGKPIIYFKTLDKNLLKEVLENLGNDFLIFDYDKKYVENDFKEAISKSPYAIWLGRHESQGFAFEETLSSNTPIFVIDIKSLREEVNSFWVNYLPGHPLKATAAAYFDKMCGFITYPESWKDDFKNFNPHEYNPRNFIVNNLSAKACLKTWLETLKNL